MQACLYSGKAISYRPLREYERDLCAMNTGQTLRNYEVRWIDEN
jgi:hypothetical protein